MSAANDVAALADKVRAIEDALQPLLSTPLETLTDGLDDEELARLNLVLAYTLNSLFYMFLKTQNVSPAGHPVRKELQRVQGYMEKLKAATAQRKEATAASESPAPTDADKAAARTLLQSLDAASTRATGDEQADVLELPSGEKKAKKKKKKKKKAKRDRDDQ